MNHPNFSPRIKDEWSGLSITARKAVLQRLWLRQHPEFRFKPIGFREFTLSPYYLDQGDYAYREIVIIGETLMRTRCNECIVEAGLGSGKSYLAALLISYIAHLLLCLKNPHGYYNLSADKPITILNMSLRETQARKVVFGSVSSFIENSVWFRQFDLEILKKSILLDKKIDLLCGNSSETMPLGLNIFAGILDEAAFYLDNEDRSVAEDIFDTIAGRIASRFGNSGLTIAISSSKHEEDFMNQKREESLEFPEKIFYIKMKAWKVKDREKLMPEVFIFDSEKFTIIDPGEYGNYDKGKGQIQKIVVDEFVKKDLTFGDAVMDDRFWIVPMDYYSAFRKNPENASRDFGAKSMPTSDLFIKLPNYVDEAFNKTPNYVQPDGAWLLPAEKPKEPLYCHIDLGLNKDRSGGRGDACGLAIGHFDGYDQAMGGRPRIRIVAIERITQDPITKEVSFSGVRQRIINLHNAGFEIVKVTLDGWQSADTIQTFNSLGILAELLSIDRTVEPYEAYKEALYEKRIEIPHHEKAMDETKHLVILKGSKIDHPKDGSKDVSDAIAGVVYNILLDYGVDFGEVQTGLIRY